jgi:hypothetical protein
MKAEYQREKFDLRLQPQQLALANLLRDSHLFPASVWFRDLLESGIMRYEPHWPSLHQACPPGQPKTIRADAVNLPWLVLRLQHEQHELFLERPLRAAEAIPPEAVSLGVSLDGVMVPMKDGERPGKRAQAQAQGQAPSGPAGYQEVGCGTISDYDRAGERLVTRRMARMPEPNKAALKRQLTAEVMGALIQRPDLHMVKLADGTPNNWTFLRDTFPLGDECLDFYHASEYLSDALAAAYGEGTPRYRERFDTLREVRRDDPQGADKVSHALCRLRTRDPRRQVIHKAVAYFREHRHRMPYARVRASICPSDLASLKRRVRPWPASA